MDQFLFCFNVTDIVGVLMRNPYGPWLAAGHQRQTFLNAIIVMVHCVLNFRYWIINLLSTSFIMIQGRKNSFCVVDSFTFVDQIVDLIYFVGFRFCLSCYITFMWRMTRTLLIGLQLLCIHVKPLVMPVWLTKKNLLGSKFLSHQLSSQMLWYPDMRYRFSRFDTSLIIFFYPWMANIIIFVLILVIRYW